MKKKRPFNQRDLFLLVGKLQGQPQAGNIISSKDMSGCGLTVWCKSSWLPILLIYSLPATVWLKSVINIVCCSIFMSSLCELHTPHTI